MIGRSIIIPAMTPAAAAARLRQTADDRREQVLQAYSAAGDPAVGEHVARGFKGLVEHVRTLSGASPREVAIFFAGGMLANVTTILGLPEVCEPLWEEPPA